MLMTIQNFNCFLYLSNIELVDIICYPADNIRSNNTMQDRSFFFFLKKKSLTLVFPWALRL